MRPDRENNYDLLRISCAIAIVVMHASGPYVLAATNNEFFGEYYVDNMLFSCMCNGITRFAVPCFVMLSGAFILDNDRNRDYRYFYKKAFCKIGITTLIFSILYTVYSFAKSLVGVVAWGKGYVTLWEPLVAWIKGEPFLHMWYLYMLAGVYMLVPVVIRFRESIPGGGV